MGSRSVSVGTKGHVLTASNRHLSLAVDLASGSLTLAWKRKKAVALRNAAPAVRIGGAWRSLAGAGGIEHSSRPVVEGCDKGIELRLTYRSAGDVPEVTLVVRLYEDLPYAFIALTLRNRGTGPVAIGKVHVLAVDGRTGGSLELGPTLRGAKVYLESNNLCWTGVKELFDTSLSQKISYVADAPGAPALAEEKSRGVEKPGFHESASVGALWNPDPGVCFMAGFVTSDLALSKVTTRVSALSGIAGWEATCSYDEIEVPPGGELAVEKLIVEFSDDPFASLERYGRAFAARYGMAPAPRVPHLWCSWYSHRLTIDEKAVLDNARIIAERYRRYGVDTVQIDYGWNWRDTPGEWRAHSERFPHGMKWLAERLREMDLKLGLWIAPFYVGGQSRLYQEHPEVLLRNPATGEPVKYSWEWNSQPRDTWQSAYLMDTTTPYAQRWLREVFREIASWGVDYLKMDFLDAGSQAPLSFSSKPETSYRRRDGEQMRAGLGAIREAVGKDAYLLGCNLPISSGIGILSAVFTAMDVGNAVGSFAHLKSRMTTLISRWYQQNVTWWNDPDVINLSGNFLDRGSVCGIGEARIRCTAVALCGGPVLLGDDLPSLPEDRLQMYTLCLPACGRTAVPVDLFTHDHPRIWSMPVEADWGRWQVVGLFNYDASEVSIPVSFKDLGLSGAGEWLAWEFWDQEFLGRYKDGLVVSVPRESARVIALRKKEKRPSILSTSFHIAQGARELSGVRWSADGSELSLTVARHRGARGSVFFNLPGPSWQLKEGRAVGAKAAVRRIGAEVQALDLELEQDRADLRLKFSAGS